MGISEKNKKMIFNENLRVNTKHDFNQQGSGLGLSICLSLVKLLNLKIEFFSKLNKGSSFSLLVPVRKIKKEDKHTVNNYNHSYNNITNKDSIIFKRKNSEESKRNNMFINNINNNEEQCKYGTSSESNEAPKDNTANNQIYAAENSSSIINSKNQSKTKIAINNSNTKANSMCNINRINFNKIMTF